MLLTRSPLIPQQAGIIVRLACVKHAASVHPEPGSNSPLKSRSSSWDALGPILVEQHPDVRRDRSRRTPAAALLRALASPEGVNPRLELMCETLRLSPRTGVVEAPALAFRPLFRCQGAKTIARPAHSHPMGTGGADLATEARAVSQGRSGATDDSTGRHRERQPSDAHSTTW